MSEPWLARLCSKNDSKEWTEKVWAVDGCSVATNGKWLLAYKDGGVQCWPVGHQDDWKQPQRRNTGVTALKSILDTRMVPQFACQLIDLVRWCEYVSWSPCEDCQGEGCVWCNEGRVIPGYEANLGWVGKVRIRKNSLAYVLAPELLTEENAEVQISHNVVSMNAVAPWNKPSLLFITGELFELALMTTDESQNEDDKEYCSPVRPTFYPDPLYTELWVGRNDPVCRAMLIDWLIDRDDPYAEILRASEPSLSTT